MPRVGRSMASVLTWRAAIELASSTTSLTLREGLLQPASHLMTTCLKRMMAVPAAQALLTSLRLVRSMRLHARTLRFGCGRWVWEQNASSTNVAICSGALADDRLVRPSAGYTYQADDLRGQFDRVIHGLIDATCGLPPAHGRSVGTVVEWELLMNEESQVLNPIVGK